MTHSVDADREPGTRSIALTKGYAALVDDEDYEMLMEVKWFAHAEGRSIYATRKTSRKEGHKCLRMHRLIMSAPDGMEVDHVNHNGLDNRRENLRLCTHVENSRNSRRRACNTSGYKGVYKCDHKWRAIIGLGGRTHHLGTHATEELAARAYDAAALLHYGAFANLNFPVMGENTYAAEKH